MCIHDIKKKTIVTLENLIQTLTALISYDTNYKRIVGKKKHMVNALMCMYLYSKHLFRIT